jgi:hypothetical protein
MFSVTNHGREAISFRVKKGNGRVGPGETEVLDIDENSAQVQGRVLAGLITVEKTTARASSSSSSSARADEKPAG